MLFCITAFLMASGLADASFKRQAAAYDALTTGSEVGLLHGLEYSGARVANDSSHPIVPHSKPKFAEGSRKLGHFQHGGVSADSYIDFIAAQNVSSFDLYRFWFACAVIDGKTFGPAQPCTLAVVGFSDDGRNYSSTFDYKPSSDDQAPMVEASFYYPIFREIQNVSIGIVTGSAPAGKTAIVIDSLEHINYA